MVGGTGSNVHLIRKCMMKNLQKIGGIAALVQGILFIVFPLFLFVILPSQGLQATTGPNFLADPAIVLTAASTTALVSIFGLLDVPIAVSLILIVLALHERLQADSPMMMRIAAGAGLVGTVLFLAVGMVRFTSISQLAALYSHDQAGVAAAYLAADTIVEGLNNAAVFAFGWWVLLASWAGLQTGGLPKLLCSLGLLLGVSGIITFVLPVPPVLGIVWFPWLGAVLLGDAGAIRPEIAASTRA
jgi:hypothetical protein